MKIFDNSEKQLNSELKNVHSVIFQKYEFAREEIAEAHQKIDSFINFCHQETVQRILLEKINSVEWHCALNTMEFSSKSLLKIPHLMYVELENFEKIIDLTTGNVSDMFYDRAEKVLEMFISIQLEVEEYMKKIEEIINKFTNLARTDEM